MASFIDGSLTRLLDTADVWRQMENAIQAVSSRYPRLTGKNAGCGEAEPCKTSVHRRSQKDFVNETG